MTFHTLLERGIVLLDGATGSNLMKAGMPRGVCTEQWVAEHPEAILQLQRAYIDAGTQILYAPTFSANRCALARHGLADRVVELNTQLVALAREAAGGKALVAGDLTTTGVPLEPVGELRYDELFDIYAEQIRALYEAGADVLVAETMLGLDETTVALEASKSVCDLPVLCSLTVQGDGSAYFNGNCVDAVETLQALGAAAVGINCSCGPEQLLPMVRQMKKIAQVPLLLKPNAGMPILNDAGEAVYPMQPKDFAREIHRLVDAGAQLVGGCCGTTPAFIAALRDELYR